MDKETHTEEFVPGTELPWRSSGALCNARLLWGTGYCENGAGAGTNHVGEGRCSLHGGEVASSIDVKELISQHGLSSLVDIAETMDYDDAEYMYHVTNSALVVQRAKIVARLGAPDTTAKELADLTMALKRVDDLLAKYKKELKGVQEAAVQERSSTAEEDRLAALEAKFGT